MRPLTILSVQFSRCQPCPASSFPCNGPSGHFFESHMGTTTRREAVASHVSTVTCHPGQQSCYTDCFAFKNSFLEEVLPSSHRG